MPQNRKEKVWVSPLSMLEKTQGQLYQHIPEILHNPLNPKESKQYPMHSELDAIEKVPCLQSNAQVLAPGTFCSSFQIHRIYISRREPKILSVSS